MLFLLIFSTASNFMDLSNNHQLLVISQNKTRCYMLTVKRKKKHLHLIKSGELNCQSPGYRTVGPVKCYYRGEISETLMPGKSRRLSVSPTKTDKCSGQEMGGEPDF